MNNVFSLQLVQMFNYYCDVVADYNKCAIILILLSSVTENFKDISYYTSMINNQSKLKEITDKILLEIERI